MNWLLVSINREPKSSLIKTSPHYEEALVFATKVGADQS